MADFLVSLNTEQVNAITRELAKRSPTPTIDQFLQQTVTTRAKDIVARSREHDESAWIIAIRDTTPAQRQDIKTILGL